jgi:diadenosine tetraphosphate (Ap4A) HIT family hydrolase
MPSTDCPFCRKLSDLGSLAPEELIWQFPHSVALLGPWQYYQGYCILVARTHATELDQLPDAERVAYFNEMCLLARAIGKAFRPRKLNYELLGNQVPHLHWHLFPRYDLDPDMLKPVWLALERGERDETERRRLETGIGSRSHSAELLQEQLILSDCDGIHSFGSE